MSIRHISMMRAAAPKLEVLAVAMRRTWREIAASGESMALAFQTHRFNGTEEDRAAGVAWIGDRIVPTPAIDRLMVTNGTMNSILLLSSSIVGPGGTILAEELTFPIAYTLTEIAGVNVQGVEIDDIGMIPEDFEHKCRYFKPKAVYVNCTVHSPTAYVTPNDRRERIAHIARQYNVQILEDEAQSLYVPNAPRSFATIAPDITWYMMGLSKYIGLGVRMAYVVAPSAETLEGVLVRLRPVTTWHPAPIIASIVTRWIQIGEAQAIMQAARDEVHRRQEIASEILGELEGFRSSPGIHFWLKAPDDVSSLDFSKAVAEAGVVVRPSRLYSGNREPRLQGIRPGVGEPSNIDETRCALNIIRHVYKAMEERRSTWDTSSVIVGTTS